MDVIANFDLHIVLQSDLIYANDILTPGMRLRLSSRPQYPRDCFSLTEDGRTTVTAMEGAESSEEIAILKRPCWCDFRGHVLFDDGVWKGMESGTAEGA